MITLITIRDDDAPTINRIQRRIYPSPNSREFTRCVLGGNTPFCRILPPHKPYTGGKLLLWHIQLYLFPFCTHVYPYKYSCLKQWNSNFIMCKKCSQSCSSHSPCQHHNNDDDNDLQRTETIMQPTANDNNVDMLVDDNAFNGNK